MDTKFIALAPVAILPGLMCDSRMFAGQIAVGAQVVDGFYGGARRMADMADYALARLPERFMLVGHSMGARVALEILRMAPDRVMGIALADTGVHPVQPGEADKRHALRDLGHSEGMGALIDAWLPPMLGTEARKDSALYADLRAMCLDAGIETYEAQIEALLSRPSVDDVLAAMTCPALSVTGEQDAWSPPAQHEAIAAAIPDCVLRIVPGAGHMLPAEKPKKFNAVLQEWLAVTNT
ncbi:alpha/beta fold hydrolase [Croceicoccus sediminis]|uniref:alpha/beta fold hydrolase n=1 Tax=Croceicoccus sediminis TaxID=2571150 RepID=UPI001181CE85|nr:alpha/beta hydrolase [Croceicoccus sediminis]